MIIYTISSNSMDEAVILEKGFRNDVFVEIEGIYYNLFIIEPERLISELELTFDIENRNFFVLDTNTIVLKRIDNNSVAEQISQIGESAIKLMAPCSREGDEILFCLSSAEKEMYAENGWNTSVNKNTLTRI